MDTKSSNASDRRRRSHSGPSRAATQSAVKVCRTGPYLSRAGPGAGAVCATVRRPPGSLHSNRGAQRPWSGGLAIVADPASRRRLLGFIKRGHRAELAHTDSSADQALPIGPVGHVLSGADATAGCAKGPGR